MRVNTYNQEININLGAALKRAPWPGALGQRIQNSICQEAWKMWLGEQTISVLTHSAHWVADSRFVPSIKQFCAQEKQAVQAHIARVEQHLAYK